MGPLGLGRTGASRRGKCRPAIRGLKRESHWQRLGKGSYLGFRRGPDIWIARFKRTYKALETVASDDFDAAKHDAEDRFAQVGAMGGRRSVPWNGAGCV